MSEEALQSACEQGQRELMETRYLDAVHTLVAAEAAAWTARDFDTLARLYLPLQESRRQARQRCGEGIVDLSIIAADDAHPFDPGKLADKHPHGQLLIAEWMSTTPAARLREIAGEKKLYVETFLAAVYPARETMMLIVLPLPDWTMPPAGMSRLDLLDRLPYGSITLDPEVLPLGSRHGSTETYAEVMALWEQLHRPFLDAADAEKDPIRKMERYRKAIAVDPACELAHQHLADVARELARHGN
jgi:hypothetical protein